MAAVWILLHIENNKKLGLCSELKVRVELPYLCREKYYENLCHRYLDTSISVAMYSLNRSPIELNV